MAVSLCCEIRDGHELSSAVDVYVRSVNIGCSQLEKLLLKETDVVLLPETGKLHWTDFGHAKELIAEGERVARERLPAIRKALPLKKRLGPLRQILRHPKAASP